MTDKEASPQDHFRNAVLQFTGDPYGTIDIPPGCSVAIESYDEEIFLSLFGTWEGMNGDDQDLKELYENR
jgi:hypothetical protein